MKFVFLNYGDGYLECTANAVKNEKDVCYFKKFRSRLVQKLFFLHNAWPLNQKKELPLKKIWFRRCLSGMKLQANEEIVFLLAESFHMTYSVSFLKYLKRKYPKAKLCFLFSNPVETYHAQKLKKIRTDLDLIVTFYQDDAEKYGFSFRPLHPYRIPAVEPDPSLQSDVFFIGAEKGRLDVLIKIFEKLQSAGLECLFYIVGVEPSRQKYQEKIVYNQRLTYQEVLQRVASTGCVLEVLQNDDDYISIRTIEAMQCHKKLLTNSSATQRCSFYRPEIIQVFRDAEEIDTSFFYRRVNDELFPGDEIWSFSEYRAYLISQLYGEEKN